MRQEIFAVLDSKAAAFGIPFFAPNKEMAVRNFRFAVSDPNSTISKAPEDFTLYHLGGFDDGTAAIETFAQPVVLVTALQLKE